MKASNIINIALASTALVLSANAQGDGSSVRGQAATDLRALIEDASDFDNLENTMYTRYLKKKSDGAKGSSTKAPTSSLASTKAPKSTKAPTSSLASTKAPKSTKAPTSSLASTKAPTVKSTKAPTSSVASTKAPKSIKIRRDF